MRRRSKRPEGQPPASAGEGSITAGRDISGIASTGPFTTNVQYINVQPKRAPNRVRVRDTVGTWLGVHRPIQVPGADPEALPAYVPRDIDLVPHTGLQERVRTAARNGGFLVLVGGSSTGKTRSLFETVTLLLPDWWLVHPTTPDQIDTLAEDPTAHGRMVVWLDELHNYLEGKSGLDPDAVRTLLQSSEPVVVVGTLQQHYYSTYTAVPGGGLDSYARARAVLNLATILRISDSLSDGERQRAEQLAATDVRIREVLKIRGYGFTQTMAAAPQLMERWWDADPYAKAVLNAAIDAARLGAREPLPVALLLAAAPGYCTSEQRARAPDNWFGTALGYATTVLYGAASALEPVAPPGMMGEIIGYRVADYLLQQASIKRETVWAPAELWQACLTHVKDPADIARLGLSASYRALYCYAIPFLWRAADDGNAVSAFFLTLLLQQTRRLDELQARYEKGDQYAAIGLAALLRGTDRENEIGEIMRGVVTSVEGSVPSVRHLTEPLAEWMRQRDSMPRTDADASETADQVPEQVIATALDNLLKAQKIQDAFNLLYMLVAAGRPLAAQWFETFLESMGRHEDSVRLRSFGMLPDGSRPADRLDLSDL